MRRHNSSSGDNLKLPDWIFEVDETDDPPRDISLLQELEIDVKLISSTTIWMFFYPIKLVFRNPRILDSITSNPLSLTSAKREFWGPFFLV
jgi:hypothetical protein